MLRLKGAGDRSERLYLTDSVPQGGRQVVTRYAPQSGLFRSFAELKPHKDQILKFANRWGIMTNGNWVPLKNSRVIAEPLDLWLRAIADFTLAFRIWEWIKRGDASALGRYIKWKDSSSVIFVRSDDYVKSWRIIADRKGSPSFFDTFRVDDLIVPAWHQLQYILNEKLDGKVSARLLWNSSWSRLSLYQVPTDLISAMWLQLARAVEGDRNFQQCEECRNWFEVSSPDGSRKDKRFCGTACRARFWRKANKGEGEKK